MIVMVTKEKLVVFIVTLRHIALLASNFDISAVYGRIGLCFGYGAPVGLCYQISRARGPISRFRGP